MAFVIRNNTGAFVAIADLGQILSPNEELDLQLIQPIESITRSLNSTSPGTLGALVSANTIDLLTDFVSQGGEEAEPEEVAQVIGISQEERDALDNVSTPLNENNSPITEGDVSSINHDDLQNSGSNTHAQLDSHVGDSDVHFEQGDISILSSQISDKGSAGGIAELDGAGKIPSAQIPSIAITDVYVVADITARDALSPGTGDIAKVLDDGDGTPGTYIWDGSAWQQISDDSVAAHAGTHERGGTDQIDGDHLDIDFNPSNYTPDATIPEASNVDDLSAHLKGIDTALAATSLATQYVDLAQADDGQDIANDPSWTDVDFNEEREIDSIFSHATGSAELTINQTGRYLLVARVSTRVEPNDSSRSVSRMRVMIDDGGGYEELDNAKAYMYNRESGEGYGTGTTHAIIDVTAGTKVKLQAQRFSGGSQIELVGDGCGLTLCSFKGEKGDQGDPGPAGSFTVRDEGSSIGTFNEIDFQGAQVEAQDGGTKANIIVSAPVFGSQYQDTQSEGVSSTASATFQTKATLTTGNLPNGKYRISVSYFWHIDAVNAAFEARLQRNGADITTEGLLHRDAENTGLFGQQTADESKPVSYSWSLTLSGVQTFTLQYRSANGTANATIWNARIEIMRVE